MSKVPPHALEQDVPVAMSARPFPIIVDRASLPTAPLTRPSLFVRVCMGPMTRVLNPFIRRVAGSKHLSMAAQIHHRGRRSGQLYVTPASARLREGTFWIPLTFGTGSDWCRNVLAAGECSIRWKGGDFVATRPVVVDRASALSAAGGAFKAPERMMMRALGIKHFLRLDLTNP
jgi:deazaflavin-dependent oxidoreductase (nitroreductase family)